jgi:hypothetical protein
MGSLNGFVFKSLFLQVMPWRLDAIRAKLINNILHNTRELTGVNVPGIKRDHVKPVEARVSVEGFFAWELATPCKRHGV